MNQQNKFRIIWFCTVSIFCICLISSCSTARPPVAVVGASEPEIVQAIESDKWIFVANQAMPQRGRARALTTTYSIILSNDTLTSALPYFGRAYSAPIGQSTSPLDFKSTDFAVSKDDSKKGKWNITVKPNDYREVQSYNFTLFTNGSAQLNVQLINRSPISFSGTIMPVK